MMGVMSALNYASVGRCGLAMMAALLVVDGHCQSRQANEYLHRLRKTWSKVGSKAMQMYKELEVSCALPHHRWPHP